MAVEIDASSEALEWGDLPFLSGMGACTFAFTVIPRENPAATLRLFHQWDNTSGDRSFLIYAVSTDFINFTLDDGAGALWGIRTTNAEIVDGTLIRVVCRKDSSASVGCSGGDIWVTGGGSSPVACTNLFAGSHITTSNSGQPLTLGRQGDAGSACMLGEYSELAIWDAEIPDWVAEAYAEHGMSPRFWPYNLQFYAPLWNLNHRTDQVGGIASALTGTPISAEHPSVYYPGKAQTGVPAGAAPALVPLFPQQIETIYPKPGVVAY